MSVCVYLYIYLYIYAHTTTYRHIHVHLDLHSIGRRSTRAGPLVSASCVLMLHCVNHGLTRCNCNTIVSIMTADSRSTMLLPNFRLPLASSMLP